MDDQIPIDFVKKIEMIDEFNLVDIWRSKHPTLNNIEMIDEFNLVGIWRSKHPT